MYARDGGRCAFRDSLGLRCTRRNDLEFHHRRPFALGGDHSPANLTLMCRAHNTLMAEQDYGQNVMARFRGATSRDGVRGQHTGLGSSRPSRLSSGVAVRAAWTPGKAVRTL